MIRGRRKEKIAMNPDDEILRRKFKNEDFCCKGF